MSLAYTPVKSRRSGVVKLAGSPYAERDGVMVRRNPPTTMDTDTPLRKLVAPRLAELCYLVVNAQPLLVTEGERAEKYPKFDYENPYRLLN